MESGCRAPNIMPAMIAPVAVIAPTTLGVELAAPMVILSGAWTSRDRRASSAHRGARFAAARVQAFLSWQEALEAVGLAG